MKRPWDDLITGMDRKVYGAAGYGKTEAPTPGSRPAVLVVDVTVNFVGDRPEPILESIKRYPNSCGEMGWEGVRKIALLLKSARRANVPVFYSIGDISEDNRPDTSWSMKKTRHSESDGNRVPEAIAPRPSDTVIAKRKPSVFFGTPFISVLNSMHIDTLVVTGCTTSGCVRATVLDAFSYSFKTLVVEECVFDRAEVPHKINLFDMNEKYADVIGLAEATRYLDSLSRPKR